MTLTFAEALGPGLTVLPPFGDLGAVDAPRRRRAPLAPGSVASS